MKKLTVLILVLGILSCSFFVRAEGTKNAKVFTKFTATLFNDEEESLSSSANLSNGTPEISSAAYQFFHDEMADCSDVIDVARFGIKLDDFQKFFDGTLNYYADLFHVIICFSTTVDGVYIAQVCPVYTEIADKYYTEEVGEDQYELILPGDEDYRFARSRYNSQRAEYYSHIDRIIDGIKPNSNDIEKILYVHDYLVSNYEYDNSLVIRNPYDFFIQKIGVCQAYTQAFNAIMHRLGIESTSAMNDTHTWNIVKIGNKNYHIDCTHDDPSNLGCGNVNYIFFLLSDETIVNYQSHYDWYVAVNDRVCDDTTYEYDYVWNFAIGKISQVGENYYYIDINGNGITNFCKTDSGFINKTFFNNTWYIRNCSGTVSVGTDLYLTTSSDLLCFNTLTNTFKNGFLASPGSKNFFTSRYEGNGKLRVFKRDDINTYSDESIVIDVINTMGDIDGSGVVNANDIAEFQNYLLSGVATYNYAITDLNGNNRADLIDLIKMKRLAD